MYNAHRYCILSKLGFENPALQIVPIKKRIVAGECHVHMLKSVNLQYIRLVCWDAGTKDSLTKRLMPGVYRRSIFKIRPNILIGLQNFGLGLWTEAEAKADYSYTVFPHIVSSLE